MSYHGCNWSFIDLGKSMGDPGSETTSWRFWRTKAVEDFKWVNFCQGNSFPYFTGETLITQTPEPHPVWHNHTVMIYLKMWFAIRFWIFAIILCLLCFYNVAPILSYCWSQPWSIKRGYFAILDLGNMRNSIPFTTKSGILITIKMVT